MKYFLDTEFIEKPGSIQLISIGIIAENGDSFYAISSEFNEADADPWVKENVISKLEKDYKRDTISTIKSNLMHFIARTQGITNNNTAVYDFSKCEIEFWGYYCDYDWVVFCWIFGRMIELPKGFPMYCRDLKQSMDKYGLTKEWKKKYCPDPEGEHNALVDAKWNMHFYMTMKKAVSNTEELSKLNLATQAFAGDMFEKLKQKANEGWRGWDKPEYTQDQVVEQISKHVERLNNGENQVVDIANLCMFYWYKVE